MSRRRNKTPAILILGAGGQVGGELCRSMALAGRVVALTRAECDLSSVEQMVGAIRRVEPDVIVNAGGYTAVDLAESNAEMACAINANAPATLAAEALARQALLVHYSTDYVFDGTSSRPYTEEDEPNPLSVYGRSKADGERAVVASGCKYLIFRTSWIYGVRGKNFLKTIARAAQTRDALSIVADQLGAPTSASLVADVTALAVRRFLIGQKPMPSGIYHLTASGETNWYEYARLIVDTLAQAGVALRVDPGRIASVTSSEYPTPARRPLNSRLDTSLLRQQLEIELPDWQLGVREHLALLVAGREALL
jgi:dTDP-4-dehydrorhamnose reductase